MSLLGVLVWIICLLVFVGLVVAWLFFSSMFDPHIFINNSYHNYDD